MLVRLKEMQGVEDVVLKESAPRGEAATAASRRPRPAGAGSQCGHAQGEPNYEFEVTVTFDALQPATADPNKGRRSRSGSGADMTHDGP